MGLLCTVLTPLVSQQRSELHDTKYNDANNVIMISRTNKDRRLVSPDFKLPGLVLNTCSQ